VLGLDNINANSILNLRIIDNPSLSTCAVQSICDYLTSPNGTVEIHDNATGCNSQEEVEIACAFGINDKFISKSHFFIYPNPASTQITISTPTTPPKNTFMTIYNLNGQALLSRQITEEQTVIDVGTLPQGIYFLKVADDRTVQVGKFIKQ